MTEIELDKLMRADAIASLKRYAEANLSEPLGTLAAGQMLDFFLEEIGPAIYNRAIRDAQARLQQQVLDLSGELFADEMQYWPRLEARRVKARRQQDARKS